MRTKAKLPRDRAFNPDRSLTFGPALLSNASLSDFSLWQLSDSAFPTGGFAHSSGLEAAWQHGELRSRNELLSFLETNLVQLGRMTLPFVTAAWDQPENFSEIDQLCEAFLTNHVANRASRSQGKAFLAAIERIFLSENNAASPIEPETAKPNRHQTAALSNSAFTHLAPTFGICLKRLNAERRTTLRLFAFNHLRGLTAAAVRLNLVGPMEAQALQHRLSQTIERVLQDSEFLTLDDLAQTAPLLDLWQGAQDRLYSRLFQS